MRSRSMAMRTNWPGRSGVSVSATSMRTLAVPLAASTTAPTRSTSPMNSPSRKASARMATGCPRLQARQFLFPVPAGRRRGSSKSAISKACPFGRQPLAPA
jgi:hypothetical protein